MAAKRILVVDDDAPTQLLIATLLRRDGFECVVAENGKDAIRLLTANRAFSAIVLDLMMPTSGGRDVIAHLEKSPHESCPPIIVCTAAGPRETATLQADLVKVVIRKPFDIEDFAAAVASVT